MWRDGCRNLKLYSWQRKGLARPFLVSLHFAERDSPAHNWSCGLLQKSMSLATQSGLPFSLSWMRTTWRKATRHTLNKAQDTANNGKASTARIRKSKPSSSSSTLAAKAGVGIEAAAKPAATTAPWACCISLRATACGPGRKALLSCPTKHATAASSRREAKRDRAIAFAEHVGFRRTHCGLDQLELCVCATRGCNNSTRSVLLFQARSFLKKTRVYYSIMQNAFFGTSFNSLLHAAALHSYI